MTTDQPIKEKAKMKNLIPTIFRAIAAAAGIAVIVLNVLGTLSIETAVTLMGIGLTSLAISSLHGEVTSKNDDWVMGRLRRYTA